MYVRIKRQKTTIFLHIEPTDRIEALKARIEELLQYPASKQRIYKTNTVLEDGKSLAEERIENNDVLVLALQSEGVYVEWFGVSSFWVVRLLDICLNQLPPNPSPSSIVVLQMVHGKLQL